jgi:hypothetical protein
VSVLLHRGSRIVKDFDVIRFSKSSSVDQNFVVEADSDSRMSVYQNIGLKLPNGRNEDHSNERLQRNPPE